MEHSSCIVEPCKKTRLPSCDPALQPSSSAQRRLPELLSWSAVSTSHEPAELTYGYCTAMAAILVRIYDLRAASDPGSFRMLWGNRDVGQLPYPAPKTPLACLSAACYCDHSCLALLRKTPEGVSMRKHPCLSKVRKSHYLRCGALAI